MTALDDYRHAYENRHRTGALGAQDIETMIAEIDRLRSRQAFTHAADCLSRVPDFDARDCSCR